MTWRKNIEKGLKPYVENIIRESFSYREQYRYSGDQAKAQIWVALAILSRQIYNLDLKLRFLERAIQEIGIRKTKKNREFDVGKEADEVERFIKELAGGKQKKAKTKKRKRKRSKKKAGSGIKIAKSL